MYKQNASAICLFLKGSFTLLTKNKPRLQKCFKNYIRYCSLKVVYQSKSRISWSDSKTFFM